MLLRPKRDRKFSTGFQPHERSLNARRCDARMVFVTEGQPDRSKARSAWYDAERQPRPGGTVEVVVSPVGSPGKNSPSLVSGSFKT
jgi:hypothetical protein